MMVLFALVGHVREEGFSHGQIAEAEDAVVLDHHVFAGQLIE